MVCAATESVRVLQDASTTIRVKKTLALLFGFFLLSNKTLFYVFLVFIAGSYFKNLLWKDILFIVESVTIQKHKRKFMEILKVHWARLRNTWMGPNQCCTLWWSRTEGTFQWHKRSCRSPSSIPDASCRSKTAWDIRGKAKLWQLRWKTRRTWHTAARRDLRHS